MEKILNLQRGWKSRLWFGEKAFALCFVIFTAFTGLVSVNAGPEHCMNLIHFVQF